MIEGDIGFKPFGDSEDLSLDEKIEQAHWLVTAAIHRHVTMRDKQLAGRVVLFSGGNDSTTLAHIMRGTATHFAHANTSIGVEQTRQFVRDLAVEWGIPLIEHHGERYRDLVLELDDKGRARGFPGPGMHFKMFQRLKERALRKVRADLVTNGRRQRVLFIAGRRRDESQRRSDIPEMEVEGSVVWVSPLVHWTDEDMAAYRERFDVPRNEVSDMLHMSGECLCGAYANPHELAQIEFFFPEVAAEIRTLEVEVEAAGCPAPRNRWGWGHGEQVPLTEEQGRLCSSCPTRRSVTL